MYIGKTPIVGNFQKCDAISVVNGQAAYTLQVGSANVSPESVNHMIVSLNGVIQAPTTAYTVSGATLTFASNLATGDVIDFVLLLGNVLDVGVPSDDTVGAAQIKDDLISGTTALASEPADTDEFLVSDAGTLKRIDYSLIKGGGKIGQVVSTTVTAATASTTSATYADITGMTLNITPAATSSKILVMFDINIGGQTGYSAKGQLVRDSTVIAVGAAASSRTVCSVDLRNTNDASQMIERSMSYLDSPSTTSQVTYKLQWRESENTTLYLNRTYSDVDDHRYGRAASTITAMEVLA